jgi:hypothetical protein
MSKSRFSYETRQQLPATLSSEEREAVRFVARSIRAALVRSLAWLISPLSRHTESRGTESRRV